MRGEASDINFRVSKTTIFNSFRKRERQTSPIDKIAAKRRSWTAAASFPLCIALAPVDGLVFSWRARAEWVQSGDRGQIILVSSVYSCVLSHLLSCLETRRPGRRRSTRPVLPLGRGSSRDSFSVSVLYLSCQMSQSPHSAGALAGSSLGLDGPVVASNLARGVARRGAPLLLLVPVLLSTVARERVRLVAAFSLSLSSLRLSHNKHAQLIPARQSHIRSARPSRHCAAHRNQQTHLPYLTHT